MKSQPPTLREQIADEIDAITCDVHQSKDDYLFAADQILAVVQAAVPENPYSKRAIERRDEEMPRGKYLMLVNKGKGFQEAVNLMHERLGIK